MGDTLLEGFSAFLGFAPEVGAVKLGALGPALVDELRFEQVVEAVVFKVGKDVQVVDDDGATGFATFDFAVTCWKPGVWMVLPRNTDHTVTSRYMPPPRIAARPAMLPRAIISQAAPGYS